MVHQLLASRCHVCPSPTSASRWPVSGMKPRSLRKPRPTSLYSAYTSRPLVNRPAWIEYQWSANAPVSCP
jgi:hypothetical protein